MGTSRVKVSRVPESAWRWYGLNGHFICGRWCRYHLTTKVGRYFVSTVGMYVHPSDSGGGEQSEYAWLKLHPNGREIGMDHYYETMVFKAGAPCDALEEASIRWIAHRLGRGAVNEPHPIGGQRAPLALQVRKI